MTSLVTPRCRAALTVSAVAVSVIAIGASTSLAQQLDAWGGLRQDYTPSDRTPPHQLGHDRRPLDGTPRRARYPAYDHTPPPIWYGAYLGIHGGYSIASMEANTFNDLEISGGAFGGHLGYNWEHGRTVFGVEADGTWHDNGGSRDYGGYANLRGMISQAATARLRLGYAFDNSMVYLTGGLALANADVSINHGPFQSRSQEMIYGYALGAGLEVKLSHNMSGRLEAMHYGFAEQTFHLNTGFIGIDTGVTTVRAGLTYHFR